MTEKKLLGEIKKLKQIKPNQEWVVFTKTRILGEPFDTAPFDAAQGKKASFVSVLEFIPKVIFKHNKLAFATLMTLGFVAGALTFAQNSLPGDPVFILKKITERTRASFASQEELPKIQLEFANKRLDELNKIAETNQSKKLAPAIQEFQTNISKAAKDIISSENLNVKEIVAQTQKIKENKERIEALGIVVGDTSDLDNAFLQLIQREIKDLEVRTLTQDQQKIFLEAVSDFNAGNYSSSLEKIWSLSNPQE